MRNTLGLAAAVAVAFSIGAPAYASGDHEGKIPWVKSPEEGFNQAKLSGKPILLFFSAAW